MDGIRLVSDGIAAHNPVLSTNIPPHPSLEIEAGGAADPTDSKEPHRNPSWVLTKEDKTDMFYLVTEEILEAKAAFLWAE